MSNEMDRINALEATCRYMLRWNRILMLALLVLAAATLGLPLVSNHAEVARAAGAEETLPDLRVKSLTIIDDSKHERVWLGVPPGRLGDNAFLKLSDDEGRPVMTIDGGLIGSAQIRFIHKNGKLQALLLPMETGDVGLGGWDKDRKLKTALPSGFAEKIGWR